MRSLGVLAPAARLASRKASLATRCASASAALRAASAAAFGSPPEVDALACCPASRIDLRSCIKASISRSSVFAFSARRARLLTSSAVLSAALSVALVVCASLAAPRVLLSCALSSELACDKKLLAPCAQPERLAPWEGRHMSILALIAAEPLMRGENGGVGRYCTRGP